MDSIIEIKNRSIEIETVSHREDYCKTAMLFFVLDGSVDFAYESREVSLNKMNILVLNRGTSYRCDGAEDAILASLELMGKSFESVCDGMRRVVKCDSTQENSSEYAELRNILSQMISNQVYLKENPESYAHLVFNYYSLYYKLLEIMIGSFLVDQSQNNKAGEGKSSDSERKEKIERYINIHYAESLAIEDLAEELCLSSGYLSRFFGRCFGISFSQYLREVRLKRAMSDLLYTDKNITQVSYDNGFTSSSFFNRVFREKYGKSPSEVRKEFLDKAETGLQSSKDEENLRNRVSKLVEMNPEPIFALDRVHQHRYSVKSSTPMTNGWNSIINVGSAADLLKTDIQEHIKALGSTMHFRYARFWDPFSRDMYLNVNEVRGNYNFMRLDQAIDSILENGMKPFVAFEPKLERINENLNVTIIKTKQERTIENPDAWRRMIRAFVRHIIQKYGIDEVEQWRFEIPFGVYEIEGMETLDGYMTIYEEVLTAVRQYTMNLMVGGPMLPSVNTERIREILSEFQKRRIRPDFISTISFAYDVKDDINRYAIRSGDESFLKKDIERFRSLLQEFGMDSIPLYLTEWNETLVDRNYMNDTCYRGAYIVKNLIEIKDSVEMIGYFSGTDRRTEFYDSNELLQGGNGLLSRDGIVKPAGYAISFMGRLGAYEIAADEHFIITTDRRNNFYIAAHNKKRLSYYYYKTAENELDKRKLRKCIEDESYLEQNLELTDVMNGEYEMRILRVNSHNGSVLDIWKELGFSDTLSGNDIRYIRSVCMPRLELERVRVQDGRISVRLTMEPNEIALVEVRRVIM